MSKVWPILNCVIIFRYGPGLADYDVDLIKRFAAQGFDIEIHRINPLVDDEGASFRKISEKSVAICNNLRNNKL